MQLTISEILKKHQQGDIHEALQNYHTLLKTEEKNIELLQLIGIAYGQLKEYKFAIEYLLQAHTLDPTNLSIINNLGNSYKGLKENDQALLYFQKVLNLAPGHVATLVNMGSLNYAMERFDLAVSFFERAHQIDPNQTDALFNLGICYFKDNRYKEAIKPLSHLIEIDSKYPKAILLLAQAYTANEQSKEAIPLLEKLILVERSFQVLHQLGCAYLKEDEHSQALKQFEAAYDLEPFNIENCHNIAIIHFHAGRLEPAIQHWYQIIAQDAHNIDALYNIGVAYQYMGRFQESQSFFEQIINLDSNHFNALFNLGTIYLKIGNHKKALEYYHYAERINSNDAQLRFLIAALENNTDCEYKACPVEYVENLFNQYANSYDQHVQKVLKYQGHEVLINALEAVTEIKKESINTIIDLGCGTGMAGAYLKSWTSKLIGIDCSENMILHAKKTSYYDQLIVAPIPTGIASDLQCELFYIADTLPYFGDIKDLFYQLKQHLIQGGLIVFSVEKFAGNEKLNYKLNKSGRFQHNIDYIKSTLKGCEFNILYENEAVIRHEHNNPVKFGIFVVTH